MNEKLTLNGEWNIVGSSPDFKNSISLNGTVPGFVHTDLEQSDYIKNPFWRDNDKLCSWVEDWSWTYEKTFNFRKKDDFSRHFLQFNGIDTYGEIWLNGNKIGRTNNMFISYRFDVTDIILDGENTLSVKLVPCKAFVENKDFKDYGGCFSDERIFVRRMQCTFSWDWVARFVSYGIWKDVFIFSVTDAEIDDLYIYTHSISKGFATEYIEIETTKYTDDDLDIEVSISSPDKEIVWHRKMRIYSNRIMLQADIRNPELWWPAGYGEQPLYTLKVLVRDRNGNEVSEKETVFGIRTVKVVQLIDEPNSREEAQTKATREWLKRLESGCGEEDDEPGISYSVYINDTSVFCRGANWVPAHPFPAAITEEKYERLIRTAKDGNFNMLRVWGGGIYESDAFWDACNKYGIMVSQDFMMACGVYPYDCDDFLENMKNEAFYAVKKYRNNPSLIIWYGDNENDMGRAFDDPKTKSKNIWEKALLPALEECEKSRPFFPSCPYGGKNKLSLTIGDTHFCSITENFSNRDFKDYLESVNFPGRFMSECAVSGSPNIESLLKFMNYEEIASNVMYEYHTKDNPYKPEGQPSLFEQTQHLADIFLGKWETPEERVQKLEYIYYVMARAIVEGARRNKFYCSGVLFWMYNDCWPASGWSMVDYYLTPKAGYYGFKQAAKPVITSMNNTGKELEVYICNDALKVAEGTMNLKILKFSGDVLYSKTMNFKTDINTAEVIFKMPIKELPTLDKNVIVVCDVDGNFEATRAYYYADMPFEMPLEKANVTVEKDGNKIKVTTDKYARVVEFYGDTPFSDNYFDLLPNETKIIYFDENQDAELKYTWFNK